MKYKATLSLKQMFNFRGVNYKAVNGDFYTEDKSLIEYLDKSPYWIGEKVEKKVEKKIEDSPVKTKKKKTGDK